MQGPTSRSTRRTTRRASLSRALLPLLALCAVAACDGGTPPGDQRPPGVQPGAAGTQAEVVTLLSARGSLPEGQGLLLVGAAGRRLLAPGDKVDAGDTLETPAGLGATLRLSDGTSVSVGEGSRLGLRPGPGGGLLLTEGAVSLSRPVGSVGALALGVGERGPVFELGAGRVTASFTAGSGGGVRVDAGRLGRPETGETFGPGYSLAIAASGEARPGL
ncbi:MAG TPA: hypothetical protein VM285_06865, partial [Polyangia bacterium]|nr:hypothetical protein [Polyangia bacterium]